MNILRSSAVSVLVLCLYACASAPVNFYTLLPPAAPLQPAVGPTANYLIDILPVDLPAELDQQPLVMRQNTSRVMILDHERWSSPLSDEIRSAVSTELARHLGTQNVAGIPGKQDKPVLHIKLQVRRLDVWPDKAVQLDANWSLVFGEGSGAPRVIHGREFFVRASGTTDTPATDAYSGIVDAVQRAVTDLTEVLAEDARNLVRISS